MILPFLCHGCVNAPEASRSQPEPGVVDAPFGEVEGTAVRLYTLTNASGMEARITNYGGILTHLFTPAADGSLEDIVLGYDTLAEYLDRSPYFGSLIGRYGNRIAGATFTLDGTTYELAANNGPNHLHGGNRGLDKVIWAAEPFEEADRQGLVLTYTSPDGEEGYPGTLRVRVTYTLTDENAFIVDYHATTDRPTPVNLTQHTYFNLAGDRSEHVLDHVLALGADRFTPVDSTLIPTGDLRSVANTPFDFREPTAIGVRIRASDPQIGIGGGYDHNFVLNGVADSLKFAARITEPLSGRIMEVYTTEPGMQFYTGNFLDGSITGKGRRYIRHSGFCLETQHFPNSPNQPDFPSTILRPEAAYTSRTVFAFDAMPRG